jgi:hypothetical protein
MYSYEYGYLVRKDQGRGGDTGEVGTVCDSTHDGTEPNNHTINYDRCLQGYVKGWDSTCASALKDPDARHDIYGCPGISSQMIDKVMTADSVRWNAAHSLNSTEIAEHKAECAILNASDYKMAHGVNASGLATVYIPKEMC